MEFEKMFWETINFFEENKVKYFLHGSTLLNIYRYNRIEPRENHLYDKELNFGILAEDFTDELYLKLAKFPYFNPQNEKFPNFLIFFGPVAVPPQDTDHWRITPGFSLLARFWDNTENRVEYMGKDHCLIFPKKFFEPLGTITFRGKQLPTPNNIEEYFDYYFGEWKTENRDWHWTKADCLSTTEQIGGDLLC